MDQPITMITDLIYRLLDALRRLPPRERLFQFDEPLLESLRQVAQLEQRSADEVAADLLQTALSQNVSDKRRIQMWDSLTPREQQVVAMACLGYTNRQIAGRLYLSPETIKTHMRHSLRKFGMARKNELRTCLADWDFGDWK